MKIINSTSNQLIKDLSKLNNKKDIIDKGLFLVEGRNLITETIEAGIVKYLLVTEPEKYQHYNVELVQVTDEIISKLSTNRSNRGVISVCEYKPKTISLKDMNKIVVLENVNNPGNLGTIIRTALAFNYDCVITVGDSVFVYNDKVIRSAQGALFKMPVQQLKSFDELKEFKAYKLLLSESAKELDEVKIDSDRYAVVFGNEANGISEKLQSEWEGEDVIIDINPEIESLNVAIAAGIALRKLK